MIDRIRGFLSRRAQAYRRVFNNPEGEIVLADLARFCRALESTYAEDARTSAVLDGRREVWLRIQRHLNLSEKALWEYHNVGGTDDR